MRAAILAVFAALLCACPAPQPGSAEWLARHYSEAMLESETEEMRRYLAQGTYIPDAPRNPQVAALHVIRLCPQGESPSGDRRYMLVLVGGQLEGVVQGFDLVMVREGSLWRIREAKLSVDPRGAPKIYQRNCNVSPKTPNPSINWAAATSFGVPTGLTPGVILPAPPGAER